MSRIVYLLTHRHVAEDAQGTPPEPFEDGEPLFWDDSEEDFKVLGLYSSRESAQARIEAARSLPGFRLTPECFTVHEYAVDGPRWAGGFRETGS